MFLVWLPVLVPVTLRDHLHESHNCHNHTVTRPSHLSDFFQNGILSVHSNTIRLFPKAFPFLVFHHIQLSCSHLVKCISCLSFCSQGTIPTILGYTFRYVWVLLFWLCICCLSVFSAEVQGCYALELHLQPLINFIFNVLGQGLAIIYSTLLEIRRKDSIVRPLKKWKLFLKVGIFNLITKHVCTDV